MESKSIDEKDSPFSSILTQIIRKGLISYLLSSVFVLVICFIFGWFSLENIGNGFLYGSLGLSLFGTLTFAGNTVPDQLSKLSLPKYNAPSTTRRQGADRNESDAMGVAMRFILITLMCAALLVTTGVFIKITW